MHAVNYPPLLMILYMLGNAGIFAGNLVLVSAKLIACLSADAVTSDQDYCSTSYCKTIDFTSHDLNIFNLNILLG